MGGVVRIFKSLTSGRADPPPIQWKDKAGVAAPPVVQDLGNKAMKEVVTGKSVIGNDVLAPEVEAPPEQATLLKKKKKGRYSTLLTGEKGALGAPDIERKSLLGS